MTLMIPTITAIFTFVLIADESKIGHFVKMEGTEEVVDVRESTEDFQFQWKTFATESSKKY